MAVVKKGDVSTRVIQQSYIYDPAYGIQLELTYQGLRDSITVIAAAAVAGGGRARTYQHAGPVYRATLTYGNAQDSSTEVPFDRWERVTEYIQEDIKSSPKLLKAYDNDLVALTATVKDIRDALAAGTGIASLDADDQNLYDLMAMGVQAAEVKRFVLRRRRTVSLTYTDAAVMNAVEVVYTTPKLVSTYAVPAAVANKLPPNPADTPPNCVWAWKERSDNAQYTPVLNKSEEVRDWVFGAASLMLYDLVS